MFYRANLALLTVRSSEDEVSTVLLFILLVMATGVRGDWTLVIVRLGCLILGDLRGEVRAIFVFLHIIKRDNNYGIKMILP